MSRDQREALDRRLRATPPARARSVAELRASFEDFMRTVEPPTGLDTTDTQLGGRDALVVEPDRPAKTGATILYFHGGSYVLGSPRSSLALTGELVNRSGCRAISLDYRLAPEHPFPAAIEDAVAAYAELLDRGERVVFAGDSAGGGLAVTACLAAKRRGLPLPYGVVGFSPGLDMTRSGASMQTKRELDPILSAEGLAVTGPAYVGDADPHQELLSPAVYADLTGFPPLLLQVGTNELLLDDSIRLATRARDQGVDVILDVTAGVPHVFQLHAAQLDEAREALDRAALFVRQRLS